MAYDEKPIKRSDNDGSVRRNIYRYDESIDKANIARDTQLKDSDPMIEKEGYLGVDDIDRLRRERLRHQTK